MIAIGVRDPECARAQIAGRLGQRVGHGQGRAGDFQQNLRGERQRAANGDQGATGGDVQRGGELENILAFFVAAADEDGYSDGETRPFAALCFESTRRFKPTPLHAR